MKSRAAGVLEEYAEGMLFLHFLKSGTVLTMEELVRLICFVFVFSLQVLFCFVLFSYILFIGNLVWFSVVEFSSV